MIATCDWADSCPFFVEGKTYSPQLYDSMKQRYCHGDTSSCARKRAAACLGRPNVPKQMLPTDESELVGLCGAAGCVVPATA